MTLTLTLSSSDVRRALDENDYLRNKMIETLLANQKLSNVPYLTPQLREVRLFIKRNHRENKIAGIKYLREYSMRYPYEFANSGIVLEGYSGTSSILGLAQAKKIVETWLDEAE